MYRQSGCGAGARTCGEKCQCQECEEKVPEEFSCTTPDTVSKHTVMELLTDYAADLHMVREARQYASKSLQ